jgi:hypothetical protein
MPHDVFPTVLKDYIIWEKTLKDAAVTYMVEIGWAQADIDEITADFTNLEKLLQDVSKAKAALNTAVEAKDMAETGSKKKMRVKIGLIQANPDIPDTIRQAMGLKIHDTTPSHEDPFIPSHCEAKVFSTTTNLIDWKPNGNPSGTSYVIHYRDGAEGDFKLLDVVSASKYKHKGVKAGEPVYYRVAARRGDKQSDFCDPVGLYT